MKAGGVSAVWVGVPTGKRCVSVEMPRSRIRRRTRLALTPLAIAIQAAEAPCSQQAVMTACSNSPRRKSPRGNRGRLIEPCMTCNTRSSANVTPVSGIAHITVPTATSRAAVTRLSYPATRPACAARCRVRQFSLAPLRPFGTPQQPACGQRFYGRPQPLGGIDYPHFRRQGFPFPRRMPLPRLARANVAQILSCARPSILALETIAGPEWGRREYYNSQRPVVAAPACFHARGFSSLLLWLGRAPNPPVRWHRVAGVAAPDTVQ